MPNNLLKGSIMVPDKFPQHKHKDVVTAFNLDLNYVFTVKNIPFDVRQAIEMVAKESYPRVMLSPRLPLHTTHGTYLTTNDLISDQVLRTELLAGVGFAVKVMGSIWLGKLVQSTGLVLSFFFMAEVYQQLKTTLYESAVKHEPEDSDKEYDLQETYLAAFAANVELCFPESSAMEIVGRLFWIMGLHMNQVRTLRLRTNEITGKYLIKYSIH